MTPQPAKRLWPLPRLVLAGMMILLPAISLYAFKGMAGLVITGAILLLADPVVRRTATTGNWRWLLLAFCPLALWSLATSPWAVEPDHSALLVIRLLGLVLVLRLLLTAVSLLKADDLRFLTWMVALGGTLLLTLVGIELLTDLAFMSWMKGLNREAGSNDYRTYINNGVSLLALFAWPAAFSVRSRLGNGFALAFMIMVLLAVWLGNAQTPLLALAAGGAALLLTLIAGRLAWRTAVWGTAAYILSMPLLLHGFFKTEFGPLRDSVKIWSATHRFEIWHFGFKRFLEKPLTGWGLDGSRELPGGHAGIPGFPLAEYMPLHPHNSALQVWLELGAPGALAFALPLILIGRQVEKAMPGRTALALAAATFVGFEVQAQFSFGTWQNAWLASAITAAVLCLIAAAGSADTHPRPHR